jgi:hypothetical protein
VKQQLTSSEETVILHHCSKTSRICTIVLDLTGLIFLSFEKNSSDQKTALNMGIASPYLTMAARYTSSVPMIGSRGIAGFKDGSQSKCTASPNQDLTSMGKRQIGQVSGAEADAGVISGLEKESDAQDPKWLNTTHTVWICVILGAVLLLISLCVLAHKRQNRRHQSARTMRSDEARRLPRVGIVD